MLRYQVLFYSPLLSTFFIACVKFAIDFNMDLTNIQITFTGIDIINSSFLLDFIVIKITIIFLHYNIYSVFLPKIHFIYYFIINIIYFNSLIDLLIRNI